jgi:sulfur carrier protein ThiS
MIITPPSEAIKPRKSNFSIPVQKIMVLTYYFTPKVLLLQNQIVVKPYRMKNWCLSHKSKEFAMKINLVCFSKLANEGTCDYRNRTEYDMVDGQKVEDLVQRAGIAREDVKIAFVNSRIVGFDTVLSDGDRVGLAPAVGGM